MKTTALRTQLPVDQKSMLSLGAILVVSWGALVAQAAENASPEMQSVSPAIVQGDHDFLQRMEGVLPSTSAPPASTRAAKAPAISSSEATARKVAFPQVNPAPTRSKPLSPVTRTVETRPARPVDLEPISRVDLQPSSGYASRVTPTTRDYSLSRPVPIASMDATYAGGEVGNGYRADETLTVRRAVPVYRGQIVEDRPVIVEGDYDDNDATVQEQPRRHGIGGFFHRVFGRD